MLTGSSLVVEDAVLALHDTRLANDVPPLLLTRPSPAWLAIRLLFFHAPSRLVAMDNRDNNAPESERDAPVEDPPASGQVVALRPAADAPATPPKSPAAEAMRAAVSAYVSRPDTLAAIRKKIAAKVPRHDVDDVVQTAVETALSARCPPLSQDRIPGWVHTVVRRAIARYHRRKQARDEKEGLTDLIDEHVDPSTEEGFKIDGWMVPWLEKQVAGDDRDEELFDMLLEKAHSDMTYEELAARHGMTIAALNSRVFRFRKKYGQRYERAKRNTILLLLGAVLAIALAIALWILRARLFKVEPPRPRGAVPSVPAFVPESDPARDVAHPRPPE
jgi:DNA-directed RNA polymerase specialized sigma24 family protein